MVKKRLVSGAEAGVLEEEAALETLTLQGGVVLPRKGLHRGEHAAGDQRDQRAQGRHSHSGSFSWVIDHIITLPALNPDD